MRSVDSTFSVSTATAAGPVTGSGSLPCVSHLATKWAKTDEPLPLHHSWPLTEQSRQFELGIILSSVVTDLIVPSTVGELGLHHAGCWECDLNDDTLTWSGGIFDIFGLPRDARISRAEIIAFYDESSRAAMESLRSYAIKHRRGFTLDARIHSAVGETRWMRLVAAPVCEDNKAVRLTGLKISI